MRSGLGHHAGGPTNFVDVKRNAETTRVGVSFTVALSPHPKENLTAEAGVY